MKNKKEEQELKERYLLLKFRACQICKTILQNNPSLLSKIKQITNKENEEGLIEIAETYGYGDDGNGYYRFHLVLNLDLFDKEDFTNFIYLVISYVPMPDNGYDWQVDEFHERDTSNFSPGIEFLNHLEILTEEKSATHELKRVSERKYSTCVNKKQRELSLA